MRTSALVALVLCGCFAPTPPTGVPCETDDRCPSDQRCIAGYCQREGSDIDASAIHTDDGALVTDGPPEDVDADTIPNAADNCPMASNLDQHDEDSDGVGDVCDNCPHIANVDQANTDGDGVGNVCDPHAQAADTIQVFLPFNMLPNNVSTPQGNWMITNDTYRNANNFNDTEMIVSGARDRVIVEVAGTIEAVQGDTWVSIAVGENGDPSEFHDCGYVDFVAAGGDPADYHSGVIEYYDGDTFELRAANHELPKRATGAFTIRVEADSNANLVRCTTIDTRGTANTMDAQATALEPGFVGVKGYGATFNLRYLVVIGP